MDSGVGLEVVADEGDGMTVREVLGQYGVRPETLLELEFAGGGAGVGADVSDAVVAAVTGDVGSDGRAVLVFEIRDRRGEHG